MTKRDDHELVRATLAGAPEAFEQLFDAYQGKVYNLALRITGNREDALDVAQAAFMKAYENLRQFDPSHRFFSWIYRIGLNEALDRVHRRSRFSPVAQELEAPAASPEQEARGREAGRRIQEALGQLTPEYRAVIVLRHVQGLSYEEMAEVIGVPAKTVKSRLFSARRILRRMLVEKGAV